MNATGPSGGVTRTELGAGASAVVLALLALPIGPAARLTLGCILAVVVMVERVNSVDTSAIFESRARWWLVASLAWLGLTAITGLDAGLSLVWLVAFSGCVLFGAMTVHWFGAEVATRVLFTGLVVPVVVALFSIVGPVVADGVFDVSERVVINKDLAAFFAVAGALLVRFSPALARLTPLAAATSYVVAAIVLVASDSRSMAVAGVLALGYGLACAGRQRLVAGAALAAIGGWVAAVAVLGVDAGGVFDLISSDVAEGGGRNHLWAAAWTALVDRPLLGFGLGTHVDVLLGARLESLFGISTITTHNSLLFAGLSGGFPALALLVGTTVAAMRRAPESLRVILVAVVVFGLGDAPMETPGIVLAIFGMAAAGVVSSRAASGESATARNQPVSAPPPRRVR